MSFKLKNFSLLALLAGMGSNLFALNLSPILDVPTAKTLPQGVRNVRYKGVFAKVNREYNNKGNYLNLSQSLYRQVTWGDLVKDNGGDRLDKVALEGLLASHPEVDTKQSMGQTTGSIHILSNVHVPVFAYGVFDSWTLALAMPINRYYLNVDTGFLANSNYQTVANSIIGPTSSRGQIKFDEKLSRAISQKLEDYGYRPLKSEFGDKIGDLRLVSKYNFFKSDDLGLLFTLQNDFIIPTAKDADVNKVVNVTGGDAHWGLGMGAVGEYQIFEPWSVSLSASYTHLLPKRVSLRIPEEQDSLISPDIDPRTRRQIGGVQRYEAGTQVAFLGMFSAFTAYSLQLKNADSYRPSANSTIAKSRYHFLEEKTYSNLQSAVVGLGFNTIELFKAQKFPLPFDSKVTYTRTFAGKNVKFDPEMVAVDVAFFF